MQWEGSALLSLPFPAVFFSTLPRCISKPSIFLGESIPMDISQTSRKKQHDFTSPCTCRKQLARKLLCSNCALHPPGLGAPSLVGAEALTGSWHILLPKQFLPWAQRDIYKIFQSSPELLLLLGLIGLKTNPGGFLPGLFSSLDVHT